MLCWCDHCYSLVSWSAAPGRVSCDGCDTNYTEPIGSSDALRDLLVNEFALQFSFAPDQTEAVDALVAAGPFERIVAVSIVSGHLGPDSLATTRWGGLDRLFTALPNLEEVDLDGRFQETHQFGPQLRVLRLRGSLDAQTIAALTSKSWTRLEDLELGLNGAMLAPVLSSLNAPSLRTLWIEGAMLSQDTWAALREVVGGLRSLRWVWCSLDHDPTSSIDALAPHLAHLDELWLPADCLTAELMSRVPHADCNY